MQKTTEIVALDSDNAAKLALDVFGVGGLVALPTETVYGLAADATNGEAVASIYDCLLYTSPSPRDLSTSRMPSSA